MIRYTCNTLNGDFNLTRAASALGLTNLVVESLLELFEDADMIKISERKEDSFLIQFINPAEISKIVQNPKYSEVIEQINTVREYKQSFMEKELI